MGEVIFIHFWDRETRTYRDPFKPKPIEPKMVLNHKSKTYHLLGCKRFKKGYPHFPLSSGVKKGYRPCGVCLALDQEKGLQHEYGAGNQRRAGADATGR